MGALSPVRCTFSLRGERPRQPEVWRPLHGRAAPFPSPRARRAFSLRGPSPRRRSGLRKSLDRNWGLFAGGEGGGFSGAEFAPFPSPCLRPPAGMGRLFSGVSQSLCFAYRRWFVPVGYFFLALPQFKQAPSGSSLGPYPKQCHPLFSISPPHAGGGCSCLGYFSAGSCF